MKIILILIFAPILLVFFVFGTWYIAVPEDVISNYIVGSVRSDRIKIETEGIKKGFFLTLGINKLKLNMQDGFSLLNFEDVYIKPDFASIIKLNPQLPFRGRIGSGVVDGLYDIRQKALTLSAGGINLQDIGALKLINLEGGGNLSIKMEIVNSEGNILLNIKDASLKTTYLPGGYILPLEWFNDIKGLLSAKKNLVEVKSFTLEGEGIFARIKGNIVGGAADLKMEIMPDANFKRPSLLILISPFQVSPGYYVIPIKMQNLFSFELSPKGS